MAIFVRDIDSAHYLPPGLGVFHTVVKGGLDSYVNWDGGRRHAAHFVKVTVYPTATPGGSMAGIASSPQRRSDLPRPGAMMPKRGLI